MTKRRPFRADDWHSRENVSSRLRLRGHDYSSAAMYLITVCVEHRRCVLGSIVDGELKLSVAGLMAESWWHVLPSRFPGVEVDAFVVMPNHVHGVLFLGTDASLEADVSLGAVVGWYKSITAHDYGIGVSRYGFPAYEDRFWQKSYYDRILRNERALEKARAYIEANPSVWSDDEENPLRESQSP